MSAGFIGTAVSVLDLDSSAGEFRGPGVANRLQTAIFGDLSGICKTRIQQQQTAAAEFGKFLLKTAMAHMASENRVKKQDVGMNLRSHSLDKHEAQSLRPAHSIYGTASRARIWSPEMMR
jgi:hypothetical protein